jgi:predicted nucleic acid-binding protein
VRAALDTNVLAYAEGVNGAERKREALALLDGLPSSAIVLPAQTLGELFNVLTRKARRPATKARAAVLSWQDAYDVVDTTAAVLVSAADLASVHRLGIWDAVVVAAAAEAKCRLVLSEGLHDGFTWRGVTVVNPFNDVPHHLLAALTARG